MKNFRVKLLCLILALVFAFTLTACGGNNDDNSSTPTIPPASDAGNADVVKPSNITSVTVNYATPNYSQNQEEATLTTAIDEVYGSVVYITSTVNTTSGLSQGMGCGVIVDITTNGIDEADVCYVFTCYHVVEDFLSLSVVVPDVPVVGEGADAYYDYGNIDYEKYVFTTEGENPTVSFVGGDAVTDVAVLKLDYSAYDDFTPVKAKVSNVENRPYRVGQTVFAIGNPSGNYPGTTSSGIITYVNRSLTIDDIGPIDVIQIDAPVDHGNSGGGLFNLYGELVGLVNGGNKNYNGIAFAIPVTTKTATNGVTAETDTGFVNIATQLITTAWSDGEGNFNYGYVSGRWKFGVVVKVSNDYYPQVYMLQPGSAFIGKLEVDDIITGFSYLKDGELHTVTLDPNSNVIPYYQFQYEYALMTPYVSIGSEIGFTYIRNGVAGTTSGTLKQFIYRDTGMGIAPPQA